MNDHQRAHTRSLLALMLLVPAPTIAVLAAMVWEPTRGTTLGQVIYGAAKVWILALPLVWRLVVERQPIAHESAPERTPASERDEPGHRRVVHQYECECHPRETIDGAHHDRDPFK